MGVRVDDLAQTVSPVNLEPYKHEAMDFFPMSRLPDSTVDYVHHVLDAFLLGSRSSEWRYDAADDRP